jgi:hypothetical protein
MQEAVPCTFGGYPAACANGTGRNEGFFLVYFQNRIVRISDRNMCGIGPHVRLFQ